jgi:predicted PolB exonuclease-like 3'-5' exonuclease
MANRRQANPEPTEDYAMNYKFDEFYTKAQQAAAPLSEISEFGFQAIEKGFQMQVELLGDAIDLAVDQLKAASAAKSPTDYFQAQSKLAEEYAARFQKRAEGLVASATETQATLATWVEQGMKQAQSNFDETVTAAKAAAPKPARKKAA